MTASGTATASGSGSLSALAVPSLAVALPVQCQCSWLTCSPLQVDERLTLEIMTPLNLLLGTLCVAVSASHISAPPPAVAELALLTEAAAAQGAVFLDGSPAARYISRGDPFKWIVYQEGVS